MPMKGKFLNNFILDIEVIMYDVTNSTHLIYCIIFFIFSPLNSAFYQGTFHSNTRIEIITVQRSLDKSRRYWYMIQDNAFLVQGWRIMRGRGKGRGMTI